MDVFIILQLSRSKRLNHKKVSVEIISDILTLTTLPSARVKSAVFQRVPSLNKVQVRNFSLLHVPRLLCLIRGQFNMYLWLVKRSIICECQLFCIFDIQNRSVFCYVPFSLSQKFLARRNSAQCELLCLYFQFSFTKIRKALQFFVFSSPLTPIQRTLRKQKQLSLSIFSKLAERCPEDVPRTPIWKYITKHITVVFFSILIHEMCCVK